MKEIYTTIIFMLCIVDAHTTEAQSTKLLIDAKMEYHDKMVFSKASYLQNALSVRYNTGKKRCGIFAELYEWSARQEYMDYQQNEVGPSVSLTRLSKHVYQISGGVGLFVTKNAYFSVLMGYHSATQGINNIVFLSGLQDEKWDIYSRFQLNTVDIAYTVYEAKVVPYVTPHIGVGISFDNYTGQGLCFEGKWGGFHPKAECHFGFFDNNPSLSFSFGLRCQWGYSHKGITIAPFKEYKGT